MNGESDNTDKFLNGHSSMSVDGEDPTATPRTDHARHLEEVVEVGCFRFQTIHIIYRE
jgi:hypothetical protein